MSEYQYVTFRAIDRPLDDKQFAFAERQSSHSKLSRWEMSVEYNYGEFRGDVDGLLKNGFDVHLLYSNYGQHEIKLRLPIGLPFNKATLKPLLQLGGLSWQKDAKGKAGILTLAPFFEPGDIDPLWEFDEYLDAVAIVREQLITGDLRGLYLLWLCAANDSLANPADMVEPPVPHGLDTIPSGAANLLPFFGLDPLIIQAAAVDVPSIDAQTNTDDLIEKWLQTAKEDRLRVLLEQVLKHDPVAVKAELLAEIRDSGSLPEWPTINKERSFEHLHDAAADLRDIIIDKSKKRVKAKEARDAAKAEKARQARMQEMKAAPKSWVQKAAKIASAGGTANYEEAADILADVREAVGGVKGEKLALDRAKKLAVKHPTLNMLKSALRKRGLLE